MHARMHGVHGGLAVHSAGQDGSVSAISGMRVRGREGRRTGGLKAGRRAGQYGLNSQVDGGRERGTPLSSLAYDGDTGRGKRG